MYCNFPHEKLNRNYNDKITFISWKSRLKFKNICWIKGKRTRRKKTSIPIKPLNSSVCPIYVVTYYINLVKTSWTHSSEMEGSAFLIRVPSLCKNRTKLTFRQYNCVFKFAHSLLYWVLRIRIGVLQIGRIRTWKIQTLTRI